MLIAPKSTVPLSKGSVQVHFDCRDSAGHNHATHTSSPLVLRSGFLSTSQASTSRRVDRKPDSIYNGQTTRHGCRCQRVADLRNFYRVLFVRSSFLPV